MCKNYFSFLNIKKKLTHKNPFFLMQHFLNNLHQRGADKWRWMIAETATIAGQITVSAWSLSLFFFFCEVAAIHFSQLQGTGHGASWTNNTQDVFLFTKQKNCYRRKQSARRGLCSQHAFVCVCVCWGVCMLGCVYVCVWLLVMQKNYSLKKEWPKCGWWQTRPVSVWL